MAKKASHPILHEHPDAVVVAGDLANRDEQKAKQIIGELSKAATRVFFVPGNMDSPMLVNWVDTDRVTCLHGKKTIHVGVCFLGLGGAIAGAFGAPFEFSEAEARRTLACAIGPSFSHPVTLVSHCPPKNSAVDVAFDGRHVGSEAVREFIEEKKPLLVVCGHIHEAQGVDEIGTTLVVNVGAAAHGHYASILIEEQVKIELRML